MRTIMHPVEASTPRKTAIRRGKVNVCVWFGQKKKAIYFTLRVAC